MDSGIYKITSISHPDRIYVGSAQHLKKRQQAHWNRLKKGTHPNYLLLGHFKKYGIGDLKFEIIERCAISSLLVREQFYIDSFNPSFNICKKAGNTIGRPQSQETRTKRSLKLKGRVMSADARHLMHLARIKSPEPKVNSFVLLACGLFGEKRGGKKNDYQCENCGTIKICSEHVAKKHKCKCQMVRKRRVKKAKTRVTIPNGYNVRRKANTSGFPGVRLEGKWWRARIKHKGKLLNAGRYHTKEEAHEGRQQKLKEMNVPIRPWPY